MSAAGDAVRFFGPLYADKAKRAWAARVRGDLYARLAGPEGRRDPYPLYERIRARGDFVATRQGNLATADHAICNLVLRSRHFGSSPLTVPYDPANPEHAGLTMLALDPPDHTRLRRIATPAFGPRAIAGYRSLVTERITRLVTTARGEFDFVEAIAAPLPIAVITTMLGIPEGHAAEFERYGQVFGSALTGVRGIRHAAALQEADRALTRIFAELFELRRREPGDDVISMLLAAEGDGEARIRPAEMAPMCQLLLIAGFETTVNALGNAVLAFAAHPEQWERLVADPSLAPQAAEEVLRYDSSVQRTDRIAREDVEVAGRTIRKGQGVVTLLGGANRDPRVFASPADFDITRANASDHLAFSSGIHYCLGQPLARLELSVALETLAAYAPRLRPVGRPRYRPSTLLRGPRSLPVSVA